MYIVVRGRSPHPPPRNCRVYALTFGAPHGRQAMYNLELRPSELELTQFTLLIALVDLTGEITQKGLGKLLAMDSLTLTPTLSFLVGRGWIWEEAGDERRQKLISLTADGAENCRMSNRSGSCAKEPTHKPWRCGVAANGTTSRCNYNRVFAPLIFPARYLYIHL